MPWMILFCILSCVPIQVIVFYIMLNGFVGAGEGHAAVKGGQQMNEKGGYGVGHRVANE
jgi:hypothetical protein